VSDTSTDAARRGGLPEDDALADAFASAVPRRRRRSRDTADKEQKTATPADEQPADPGSTTAGGPAAGAAIPEQDGREQKAAATTTEGREDAEAAPEQDNEPSGQGAATAEELPAGGAEVAVVAAAPARVLAGARPLPELGIKRQGPSEQRSTQCTVNVSLNVRDRFAAYQLAKKLERGSEPTNAVVVRRAVLHARKNDLFAGMLEAIRHRQAPLDDEDDDPEGLFGDVQGRRVERGRARDMAQQSFRPSYEELAVIDALVTAYGFTDRSSFLDAALDAFLPQLPEKRRRS